MVWTERKTLAYLGVGVFWIFMRRFTTSNGCSIESATTPAIAPEKNARNAGEELSDATVAADVALGPAAVTPPTAEPRRLLHVATPGRAIAAADESTDGEEAAIASFVRTRRRDVETWRVSELLVFVVG